MPVRARITQQQQQQQKSHPLTLNDRNKMPLLAGSNARHSCRCQLSFLFSRSGIRILQDEPLIKPWPQLWGHRHILALMHICMLPSGFVDAKNDSSVLLPQCQGITIACTVMSDHHRAHRALLDNHIVLVLKHLATHPPHTYTHTLIRQCSFPMGMSISVMLFQLCQNIHSWPNIWTIKSYLSLQKICKSLGTRLCAVCTISEGQIQNRESSSNT